MSLSKNHRKIRPHLGKTFPENDEPLPGAGGFALTIGDALRRQFGGTTAAVKMVVRHAGSLGVPDRSRSWSDEGTRAVLELVSGKMPIFLLELEVVGLSLVDQNCPIASEKGWGRMGGGDNKKPNVPIDSDVGRSADPIAPEEVNLRPRLPAYMDEVIAALYTVQIFEIASRRGVGVMAAEKRNGEWYINYFMCDRDADGPVHRDLVRADDYVIKTGAAYDLYELIEREHKKHIAGLRRKALRE